LDSFYQIFLVSVPTYFSISFHPLDYLKTLQKLAGLSQLLGAESDQERTRLRGELEANAASAREGIHVLIQGLRDSYKKKLEERRQQLKQYEQSLTSVMGTSDGGEDAAAIKKGRLIAQTVGVVLPDGAVCAL
jgi:hypothetical protein